MDEAAPKAASADKAELADLQFNWGEAYEISWDEEDGYWAQRRDGLGVNITADDPWTLRHLIKTDYSCKPVPREFAPADAEEP